LALVDQALRSSKPDVLIFQEGMAREGSPSESDQAILSAGALQGYDWQHSEIQKYDDTQEIETMGVAVGLPLKIIDNQGSRSSWVLGNEGYMTASVITLDAQPIVIFNVQMPPKIGRKYLWYTFIQERVADFVKTGGYCPQRVIVAGYMPTEQGAQRFQGFKDILQLKDTADEFCNIASNCYTATPDNELYLSMSQSIVSGQVDKILVHKNALVFSSTRNIMNKSDQVQYASKFSLRYLWPSKRFGWSTSVRLPRCIENRQTSSL
jgi:hypothetical protein